MLVALVVAQRLRLQVEPFGAEADELVLGGVRIAADDEDESEGEE